MEHEYGKHKYWFDLGPATESSLWTESTSNRCLDVNSFSDINEQNNRNSKMITMTILAS